MTALEECDNLIRHGRITYSIDPFRKSAPSNSCCAVYPYQPLFGQIQLWTCISVRRELCRLASKTSAASAFGEDYGPVKWFVPKKWRPPMLLDELLKKVCYSTENRSLLGVLLRHNRSSQSADGFSIFLLFVFSSVYIWMIEIRLAQVYHRIARG